MITALKTAITFKPTKVSLHLDSELVARQLTGIYKVKSLSLLPLYTEAARLSKECANLSIVHVKRAENAEADALATAALKKFLGR